MNSVKQRLEEQLEAMARQNEALSAELTDEVLLTDYSPEGGVWTKAFQAALNEHQTVIIPAADAPYVLDDTVVIPSDRKILAEDGAVIRLAKNVKVLMLRNSNTVDGTHAPICGVARNRNITIIGGVWEESCEGRMGYGSSGMYDQNRSFYGVSTCMFLENLDHLTMKNMTFRNCGGFAVQLGEISNVIVEDIRFDKCFADGIHVNGNTENIRIRNVSGWVGDDLVAFNMYDWQNSSVNFGPAKNVICEDLTLSPDSRYKALRIEPGIYTFDDGSTVDCSLNNAIFRRIHNIKTFKLYCQTPPYCLGQAPEKGDVGSGDYIFFEDIAVDLDSPIDGLPEYVKSNPVNGSFAAFEVGLNIKNLYLKNISLTLHREKFPVSYLLCIGPKSIRIGDREIFDPYFSSTAEKVYLENITINGEKPKDIKPYVREIEFDHLYSDMPSTAKGVIQDLIYQEP